MILKYESPLHISGERYARGGAIGAVGGGGVAARQPCRPLLHLYQGPNPESHLAYLN